MRIEVMCSKNAFQILKAECCKYGSVEGGVVFVFDSEMKGGS